MKKWIAFLLFLSIGAYAQTQEMHPPFWEDIQAFKKQDSLQFPGQRKNTFCR